MKLLLWIGVIVFGLGLASFFVPFPHHEKQSLSAGGVSLGVETTHSQTLPVAASLVMMAGGLGMAAAGGLLGKAKA